MRRFIKVVIICAVLLVALLELVLTWVVPAPQQPDKQFDQKFGVFRFSTQSKEGLFTCGRLAQIQARYKVNDAGFISMNDYSYSNDSNRLAIIGDSYITSFYTPMEAHIDQQLQNKLKTTVYNFGMPGSNLAQSFRYINFAKKVYGIKKFIVLVSGGDLDGSIQGLSDRKYEAKFDVTSDGEIKEMPSRVFKKSIVSNLLNKSSLFRYITQNISISLDWGFLPPAKKVRANQEKLVAKRNPIARYLVENLPKDTEILFLLMSDVTTMNSTKNSLPDDLVLLKEVLDERGMINMDLSQTFNNNFAAHNRRFDFEINKHWNPYANELVAEAIASNFIFNK